MQTNNPFNDMIENLNKTAEAVDKTTREDNKENNSTDENNDPAFVLYNTIANNAVELLQNETVIETFRKLSPVLGNDGTKSMIEMFSILLTQSAYQAVLFYDNLLKEELSAQFNHFATHINTARADIEAHHGALTVFRKQLGEIQTKLNIEKFEEQNHITPDPGK